MAGGLQQPSARAALYGSVDSIFLLSGAVQTACVRASRQDLA